MPRVVTSAEPFMPLMSLRAFFMESIMAGGVLSSPTTSTDSRRKSYSRLPDAFTSRLVIFMFIFISGSATAGCCRAPMDICMPILSSIMATVTSEALYR